MISEPADKITAQHLRKELEEIRILAELRAGGEDHFPASIRDRAALALKLLDHLTEG